MRYAYQIYTVTEYLILHKMSIYNNIINKNIFKIGENIDNDCHLNTNNDCLLINYAILSSV